MKRIALCLSGYLRTFKECWPSIKENLIQDNDVDIFIHTYDKLGHSKYWVDNNGNIVNGPFNIHPGYMGLTEFTPQNLNEKIDMNFLENIPNIKIITVEKLEDIKYKFEKFKNLMKFTDTNTKAIIFYKIYKCNELKKQYEKENNFIYDLVIRTRGDLIFTKKINFDFPEDKILINSYPWGDENFVHHSIGDGENDCLNDRFAVGSSVNIDYLSNLFNSLKDLLNNNIISFSPSELILYIYLKSIKIEKRDLFFYVNHYPPRFKKPEYLGKNHSLYHN